MSHPGPPSPNSRYYIFYSRIDSLYTLHVALRKLVDGESTCRCHEFREFPHARSMWCGAWLDGFRLVPTNLLEGISTILRFCLQGRETEGVGGLMLWFVEHSMRRIYDHFVHSLHVYGTSSFLTYDGILVEVRIAAIFCIASSFLQ